MVTIEYKICIEMVAHMPGRYRFANISKRATGHVKWQTYWCIFRLEYSAARYSASCAHRNHNSGDNGTFLHSCGLIVTIRQ